MNRTRTMIVVFVSLTWLAACATTERSELTTNSGIPLSPAMQAYQVDRYVLRNEIDPERQSIAGSVEIGYTALAPLPILELNFDGLMKVDSVTDGRIPRLPARRSEAPCQLAAHGRGERGPR